MALVVSMVATAVGSSHREAPFIAGDPRADNTDVYAFVAPDATDHVTVIANYIPLQEPAGGPNFYNFGDDVNYEIEFDNDGDGVTDIEFEFRFRTNVVDDGTFLYATGPVTFADGAYQGLNVVQTYSIFEVRDGKRSTIAENLVVPPNNVGPRSTPDYETLAAAAVHEVELTEGTMKVFAGQRDEVFPVDLGSIFDLGGLRPFNNAHLIPLDPAEGVNTTTGFNVHSIAIQVPKDHLVDDDPVLGINANAGRRQVTILNPGSLKVDSRGEWRQISRLGNPLVNEVIIPLALKDRFNRSQPHDDAQFLEFVTNPILGETIPAIYPNVFACFPEPPRDDLVTIFLTGIPGLNQPENVKPAELLRLNTEIAPTQFDEQDPMGLLAGQLDGFPNGRRLVDDVVDISLQAIAGATPLGDCEGVSPNNQLGDGVVGNDMPYLEGFPYMPTPHGGYSHEHDHS